MQIDELRSELTALADEIAPFEGDLQTLHRHDRRRRVVGSVVAAALVLVVAAATITVVRHGQNSRVQVTGTGAKEVPATGMSHIDLIVVPATPAVSDVLDASPLVARYARMPRGVRLTQGQAVVDGHLLLTPSALRASFCALEISDGFAVDISKPGIENGTGVAQAVAGKATVYDVSDSLGFDLEVFLTLGASPGQATNVLRTLQADADVASVVFINRTAAYAIFKKEFADQPALVRVVKPSDLPESLRVNAKSGTSIAALSARYKRLGGVDTVIRAVGSERLTPLRKPQPGNACG